MYTIERVETRWHDRILWRASELAPSADDVPALLIDPDVQYQSLIGFGGAFTEAAAYTLSRVSPGTRAEAIRAYFDTTSGLGYSIGRIPIHSCDFSLGNYTYVDDGDEDLSSFNLGHEERWLFPLIRDAEAARGAAIPLLASPWSPPGWMKDTGRMNGGGSLLPRYRAVWATYLSTYLKHLQALGFATWGLTVQNEPAAVQTWDSCIYTAAEERDFVRDHLGPELENSGLSDVKILIRDHNRDIMVERARGVLEDPEAAKYIWGVGFHWYVSEAFENVGRVHEFFPDTHLLFTEGCQEGGVHLGSIDTGERYARNMIGDFENWCEGYLDWNIVLDETGGPNHVGNLCDAPIIADTQADRLQFNSSYYYIGHFSRHLAPEARRVAVQGTAPCPLTAFRNPDGTLVAVALNETDETIPLRLGPASGSTAVTLEPHTIVTLTWRPQ